MSCSIFGPVITRGVHIYPEKTNAQTVCRRMDSEQKCVQRLRNLGKTINNARKAFVILPTSINLLHSNVLWHTRFEPWWMALRSQASHFAPHISTSVRRRICVVVLIWIATGVRPRFVIVFLLHLIAPRLRIKCTHMSNG